jgi:hypothetical protein
VGYLEACSPGRCNKRANEIASETLDLTLGSSCTGKLLRGEEITKTFVRPQYDGNANLRVAQ